MKTKNSSNVLGIYDNVFFFSSLREVARITVIFRIIYTITGSYFFDSDAIKVTSDPGFSSR